MNEALVSWTFIENVLISLAIGALMGMEREHTKHQRVVGVRTFALVSLLGTLFVFFGQVTGSELQVMLGFVAVMLFSIILYAGNIFKFKAVGLTTSIALLIAYGMGTLVAYGMYTQAIFVAVVVTAVMFARQRFHKFVSGISDAELLDLLEFLAVAGIIYPLIPAAPITVLGAQLDLFSVWLLVIMISLINLVGFVGSRFFSAEKQIGLMALLGGLVSSTAMSLSLPVTLKRDGNNLLPWALLVVNGSAFVRNFLLIAFFAPAVAKYLFLPVAAAALILIGAGLFKLASMKNAPHIAVESPFKVSNAVTLSFKLFAIIFAIEVMQANLPQVLYLVAMLGGMVGSASTTASLALLASASKISVETAVIASSIAMLSGAVGNLIAMRIAGAKSAAMKLLPFIIGISILYALILYSVMVVA
jgi:uncharacterized membrane protein (DUF4010 family)